MNSRLVLGLGAIFSSIQLSRGTWIDNAEFQPGTIGASPAYDIPVTDNIAPLRRASSVTTKPKRIKRVVSPSADVPKGNELLANRQDDYYIIDLKIGGASLPLQLDTGSSDTWLVQKDFVCAVVITDGTTPPCGFGAGYDGNLTDTILTDSFQRTYADGTFVDGMYGYGDVEVAGIAIPHQELALVNYTFWYGDGSTVGLMGLAYPFMTSLDGTTQVRDEYDPIFTSMWRRNLTAPVMGIALSREALNGTNATAENDSYVSFGGLPPVSYNASTWVETPLEAMSVIPEWGLNTTERGFYTMTADAYWLMNKTSSAKNPRQFPVILDVGSTLTRLPSIITNRLFQSFDPPAYYDEYYGATLTLCNASLPSFGMQLGGHIFWMSPHDILKQNARDDTGQLCRVGITEADEGPYSLGDTFLTNVVVAIDVGNNTMRFADRLPY